MMLCSSREELLGAKLAQPDTDPEKVVAQIQNEYIVSYFKIFNET